MLVEKIWGPKKFGEQNFFKKCMESLILSFYIRLMQCIEPYTYLWCAVAEAKTPAEQ